MIRVVVVDDSRLMRALISKALGEDGDISVVGTAKDALEAREQIRTFNPDVITLDVEMPNMNGLEFLRRIMTLRPTPVIMVSGTNTKGAETTLTALELGAVDFVGKPRTQIERAGFSILLCEKVRAAAKVKFDHAALAQAAKPDVLSATGCPAQPARRAPPLSVIAPSEQKPRVWPNCNLVAIGASTGGVTAINRLLTGLPDLMPPLVIAQHMPPGFTSRFANRLARSTGRDVAEATDGESLDPGAIRLAPGDQHLRIERVAGRLICRLGFDSPVGNHRPSVDALFTSVAETCGKRAIGVILTGMGSDGAQGLLQMRAAGAKTFGEAEASCIVYGMPKAAMQVGAVTEEHPVDALAARLSGFFGVAIAADADSE